MSATRVRVEMLGPVQVRVGGELAAAGGPKLRAILALLSLTPGHVVSVDTLLDEVWGEQLPTTARNTLQYHVGVLRKTLAAHGVQGCLTTREPGYSLEAETDIACFTAAASAGAAAAASGRHEEAALLFSRALDQWRGSALADLGSFGFAQRRAVSLEGQREACLEAWADAELACGRADALVPVLQDAIAGNPTRERLWEQLMTALYRTGRQDAALTAYRTAVATLDRELGVQPSARLVSLQGAILRQEPSLLPPVAAERREAAGRRSSTLLAPRSGSRAGPTLVGSHGQQVVLTGAPVVLGRSGECDLVLSDEQASRRHAQVEHGPAGFVLVDLGSTNGTFVNGRRVEAPTPLQDGDRIEMGHSLVRFVAR